MSNPWSPLLITRTALKLALEAEFVPAKLEDCPEVTWKNKAYSGTGCVANPLGFSKELCSVPLWLDWPNNQSMPLFAAWLPLKGLRAGPTPNQSLHQYQSLDDINGQTFNAVGSRSSHTILKIQRGCVARWNSFSCLLPPETRASSARSVHRIRPLELLTEAWARLASFHTKCWLSSHTPPTVCVSTIVAHQSGHWDNDCEVSWYTLMKCNIF